MTLHVGLGTFRPVKEDEITEHKMHSEHYYLPQETADLINQTKANGKRVIAVGTTSCRTLETLGTKQGLPLHEEEGYTDIFIYPGYQFKVLDGLITNFHLPESTPDYAGQRLRRLRAHHGRLRPGSQGEVSVLLVWRRDADCRRCG